MTDLQMMIMADRLLRVCGELQTMCKELMEADPIQPLKPSGNIPEFLRKKEDDLPEVSPPRCVHAVLFTDQCDECNAAHLD